jgi:hypothetical protein
VTAAARSFDPSSGTVSVEAFTGPLKEKSKKRAPAISDAAFDKLRAEARRAMQSGEWGEAGPRAMVALFVELHERVYGVPCSDLTPTARQLASFAASAMLRREFNGDALAMAMFIRWTWMREKERENWRRANGRDGGAISWRLQFNGRLLTDYRLAKARAHASLSRTG